MANIGYIQVNRYCNNACHFCSNPSNWNNITYERGITLIDDFIQRKYKWIIFTWGEPTLSPDLHKWISYAEAKWIENRMISNGMMCSSYEYIKKLADSWLKLIHFSVYSYDYRVHDFLTDTPWSWKKLMLSISNAIRLWIRVQINTVINNYNQSHLDTTVKFLVKTFPRIDHYVWNNLDPLMMRKTETAWSTLPNFESFKEPLKRSAGYLESVWKTFRIERVPLCYMSWFEWASTETRKIVKEEERIVHFLDNRETIRQEWKHWEHDKLSWCRKCSLNTICSWIYEYKKYFNTVKVYPIHDSSRKQTIIEVITRK